MAHETALGQHLGEIEKLTKKADMAPVGKEPATRARIMNQGMQSEAHKKIHTELMGRRSRRGRS